MKLSAYDGLLDGEVILGDLCAWLVVIVTPIFPDSVDRTSALRLVPLDSFDFESAWAVPLLVGLVLRSSSSESSSPEAPVIHHQSVNSSFLIEISVHTWVIS
jgi:hypothetical protein